MGGAARAALVAFGVGCAGFTAQAAAQGLCQHALSLALPLTAPHALVSSAAGFIAQAAAQTACQHALPLA